MTRESAHKACRCHVRARAERRCVWIRCGGRAALARGLTIVELLVCLAVVALLLAIAIPVLGAARQSAVEAKCVSNIRSSGAAIQMYLGTYRDTFPYLARERRLRNAFVNPPLELDYVSQSGYWPMAAGAMLSVPRAAPETMCPKAMEPGPMMAFPTFVPFSSYGMSYGLFSDASLWRVPSASSSEATLRPVRLVEVRFPAEKGLLIETLAWHAVRGGTLPTVLDEERAADARFSVAFVDGSAGGSRRGELRPGGPTPEREWRRPAPVLTTVDGAAGRDR